MGPPSRCGGPRPSPALGIVQSAPSLRRDEQQAGRVAHAEQSQHPALMAQMLAFAHRLEAEIADGLLADRAAASRHYRISTRHIPQIINLLQISLGP